MALDTDIEAKYAHNGKVIVGSAILLLILILIIILFQTYARLCLSRRLFSYPLPTNSSTSTPFNECLDPSILKSLPTFTYSSATHRPFHDCAVCLSEFADGDKGRLLPNCNHAFHSHCIDTWFGSHSNCPLCRTPVQPATPSSNVEPFSVLVSEAGEREGHVACSSLPAPIGCPRKPLALGIIIEVPEEEAGSDPVPGDHGLKWPDHGILSLKRLCSV